MLRKIVFVILHYRMPDLTRACIESITRLDKGREAKIVVVDNGSPDGSGQLLKQLYEDKENVKVLLLEENAGFANGNNLGYRYAREKLKAECIIVTNNDVLFHQKQFLSILQKKIEQRTEAVIGPDIVTPEGSHQNPFRVKLRTLPEVNKAIVVKNVFLFYFYLKKLLHLEKRIHILEKLFDKKSELRRKSINWEEEQRNIVLQGACLIFLPEYVRAEEDAFCRETFMYGEEEILADFCQKKGYQMIYTPQLCVTHLDGRTTGSYFETSVEKQIFIYKNTLNSLRVLRKQMTNTMKRND